MSRSRRTALCTVARRLLAVAFAVAFAVRLTLDPASAESLDEAMSAAYSYNPQLDAERARLRATDEDVARAMSGFRPNITASADSLYENLSSRPETVNDGSRHPKGYSVEIVQPLFQGFGTLADVRESEANVRAGRESLRDVEQRVLTNTVTSYMDVVRDQAIVQLRENNVNVLSRELKAAQDRFAVGEVTKTDVAQAQARRSAAVSQLDAARAQLKISRGRFEQVVGHSPENLVEPTPNGLNLPRSLDEAIAVGTREHPTVIAALYREQAARHTIDKIRAELLPSAQLEASFTDRFEPSKIVDEQEITRFGGRVVVPIYEGGEVYARVRKAKHEHIARLQEVEQARAEVQAQVTEAWSQLSSARAQLESDKSSLEANKTALSGVREEEKVGQRTVLDVLNAELEYIDSQVQVVATRRNIVVSAYTVLSATGRLGVLNLGVAPVVYDPEVHYLEERRRWFGLSITHEDGRTETMDAWPAEVEPAK